jgi:DNA relaxase NicK
LMAPRVDRRVARASRQVGRADRFLQNQLGGQSANLVRNTETRSYTPRLNFLSLFNR